MYAFHGVKPLNDLGKNEFIAKDVFTVHYTVFADRFLNYMRIY